MLKLVFLRARNNSRVAVFWLVLSCATSAQAFGEPQEVWTLENSIRRVLEIAPETRAAEAEVRAFQGALRQAEVWPNPEIELRADDRIGKDDATGGNDLTQLVFSQPLPLSGRLGDQKAIAEAELSAARAGRHYRHLILETQTAQRFHVLQLTTAHLRLAEQRLQLADGLQEAGRRREKAGELSKLERLRLDIIREAAQQILDKAEGKYNEALSQFTAYLGLPMETMPELNPLEPFAPVPALETLQVRLSKHPALLSANHRLTASRARVDLTRAKRLSDPVLRLFRERDLLGGRRQEVTGIGITVTLPLWDRKSGRLGEAYAQVDQTESRRQVLERDLGSRLQQSHLHLTHLVKQGEHYRARMFEPARMVFELTRKAYAAGELEILSLIDANNTYFDARERYLELLQEAWLEVAELRLASGQGLVSTKQENQP